MIAGELTLEQLAGRLNEAVTRMGSADLREPLSRCRFLIDADIKQHFHDQTTPDGQAWPPIHPRPDGSSHALWHTGMLARSYSAGPGHVENLTAQELVFGSNHEHAALHHHGGVITPKAAKALTIPLTMAAVKAGSARNFPRPLFRVGRALAERTTKGRGKKQRGVLTLHYALASSVTIPPRPAAGFSGKLAGQCEEVFARWLEERAL